MIRNANLTGSVSRKAGGLFEAMRRLTQSLAATDMEVRVFGTQDEFTEQDIAAWQPVQVSAFRVIGPKKLEYSPDLYRDLEAFAPDITHTHSIWMYASRAANLYSRRTRRPYLISPHGTLDQWALRNSRWKKALTYLLLERAHLRGAHCLRALCESEARAMRKVGLRNPIAIIPNGIDLPEVLSPPRSGASAGQGAECGVPSGPWQKYVGPGTKLLLFLGRINHKKGLTNLLKAWASCSSSRVAGQADWILAIAGWDQNGHEAQLKHLCDELNIPRSDAPALASPSAPTLHAPRSSSPSVLFLGPQFGDAKKMLYARCNSFTLPSYSEGLPVAVLEAWAFGKPVLITPQCNLPEGFTYNAAIRIETAVEAITCGLRQLFEMSDSEREAMGQRARSLVAERFNWPRIGADMKKLYEWILGGGPKPATIVDF